jgi:glutathione S-transferase
MITLYHCAAARSFRVLWTLEELGLPYDLKMLPFPPRVFAKEYKALNPLGTIPLMLDGETRMTESAAICQYLVTRYGPSLLSIGVEEPDYGAFLNWLHFGEATLTFPQAVVYRYSILEPLERRNPQVADDYAKWFLGRLRAIETALDGKDTLCGARFTVADISVGYALSFAKRLNLTGDFGPAVAAYWQRLQNREGFKKAVASERLAGEQQNVPSRV